MRVLGIDPGVTGAMALVVDGDLEQVRDLPVIDGQINVADLVAQIFHLDPDVVYIEQTQPMPKNGSIASFKLGLNTGILYGVCTSMRHPLHKVRPQEWKKHAHLIGKDKDVSRLVASERFPVMAPLFRLVKHHNRADASLIAAYGYANQLALDEGVVA